MNPIRTIETPRTPLTLRIAPWAIVVLAGLVVFASLAGGCAGVQDMVKPALPHTKASYGAFSGFKLDDTKNNDIDGEASYNSKTGDYKTKFKIRNNASDVITARVEELKVFVAGLYARVDEMDARTREQAQVGQNIIGGLREVKGMLGQLMSPLQGASIDVDGPLGKGNLKTGGPPAPEAEARSRRTREIEPLPAVETVNEIAPDDADQTEVDAKTPTQATGAASPK